MAPNTLALTHYWPWEGDDEPGDVGYAVCGAPMGDVRRHSVTPTCAACAAHLAAEDYCADLVDALAAGTAPPLVAEAAAAPHQRTLPMSPFGADIFALGVTLNRIAAKAGRR
jgi:hypothetical protein